MPDRLIQYGDTIRAKWFKASPLGSFSLAGNFMKFNATSHDVSGTVRHIRGDHPTEPTIIGVWIEHDSGDLCQKCGVKEVGPINPKYIVEWRPQGPR